MKDAFMKLKKFSTQINESTLEDLRAYARETGRSISGVVSEAVGEYLKRASVRPAFRDAMDEVLADHAELLERLAK
jgi:predicted HAD superfamily Cof-like phosphohydrolase